MIKIDENALVAAVESDGYMGFCMMCGAEHYGVEPDARKYACEECGEKAVYGAEEIMIRGWYQ